MLKKHKKAILIGVMLFAVLLSAWLFLSPKMEKEQAKTQQQELLASIENGNGTITVDEYISAIDVDFYDDEDTETVELPPIEETDTSGVITYTETAVPTPEPEPFPISGEINGIGILTIDRIDLKLPVTDGVTEAQLKIAVGHVPETAPIGKTGNAVVAGHRSYTYGDFFNRLGELVIGDTISYEGIDGQRLDFEVYEILEVLPDDQTAFEQYKDKAVITLYTCTPIRKATHRLLVRASLKS